MSEYGDEDKSNYGDTTGQKSHKKKSHKKKKNPLQVSRYRDYSLHDNDAAQGQNWSEIKIQQGENWGGDSSMNVTGQINAQQSWQAEGDS